MSRGGSDIPGPDGDECLLEGSRERRQLLALSETENRELALLADPGLAAKGVPGAEQFGEREIRDLKRSVVAARRLREVEELSAEPVSHRLSGLAVALTLCLLFLLPSNIRRLPDSRGVPAVVEPRPAPIVMMHSSVEAIGLPKARVYELADEDFSLVLVVDESFEL